MYVDAMIVVTRRLLVCLAGLAVIVLAQFSPVEAASHKWFAAHMIQHLLLMLVAAPLLVLGRANLLVLNAFPPEWRPAVVRFGRRLRMLRRPLVTWLLFAVALWGWHLPGPYQAALRSPWIHLAEHVSFFGTAVLWWASVVGRRRLAHATAMAFVFTTMLHASWLAALLTFSPRVLYPFYAVHHFVGLSALQDQQLAGVLMWVPPGILYVGVIVVLFFQWFAAIDVRMRRADAV
jgi:putative membrane protein